MCLELRVSPLLAKKWSDPHTSHYFEQCPTAHDAIVTTHHGPLGIKKSFSDKHRAFRYLLDLAMRPASLPVITMTRPLRNRCGQKQLITLWVSPRALPGIELFRPPPLCTLLCRAGSKPGQGKGTIEQKHDQHPIDHLSHSRQMEETADACAHKRPQGHGTERHQRQEKR